MSLAAVNLSFSFRTGHLDAEETCQGINPTAADDERSAALTVPSARSKLDQIKMRKVFLGQQKEDAKEWLVLNVIRDRN